MKTSIEPGHRSATSRRRLAAAGALTALALGVPAALAAPAQAADPAPRPAAERTTATTTATAEATATATTAPATVSASPSASPSATTKAAAAATYNGACGSGYKVIESTPVANSGTVFLTWNSTTGKNCAVTIRNTPGTPVTVGVSLNVITDHETTPVRDFGQYTTYAGPVYLDARGLCVEWEGYIAGASVVDSGHCG